VLLGVACTLPSLWAGIYTDDYYHRWVLTRCDGYAQVRPPRMEMFDFLDGDAARTQRMKQVGLLPWWVYDGVQARFWRPVTAITHVADYRLWPDSPARMHAQNIAWYALLVVLVAVLYRQMMGRTVAAALGAVMFAIDDAHAIPAAWIASRNAVIAGVFGVMAILCHHRWRQRAARDEARTGLSWAVAAIGCFVTALLSAEAGLATLGYLLAYELMLDRVDWRRRAVVVAPYALVVMAWRAVWMWLGYGVAAMGELYSDPLGQPIEFARQATVRLPLLLAGQAGYPPADAALVVNGLGRVMFALIGAGIVALSVWMLWGLLRHNRVARFWLAGTVMSAIPMCVAAPSNRLLLMVGIGGFGLAGQFLSMALHPRFWEGLSRRRRLGRFSFVAATIIIHLVAAPGTMLLQSRWPLAWPEMWEAVHELPNITHADTTRDLVIVNHPLAFNILNTLTSRACDGRAVPRTTTVLAPSSSPVRVTRIDDRTLEVRMENGYFPDPFARLFYTMEHQPAVDAPIELPAVRVTVLELTRDSGPSAVRFQFHAPLEDGSAFRWMCWYGNAFQPFKPPAVGQWVELPRGRFPF
jgi:hypothetical protein